MRSRDLDPNFPKWAYKHNRQQRKLVATAPAECPDCRWDIAPGDPVKMGAGVRYVRHWDCRAHHRAVIMGRLPGRVAHSL